MSGVLKKIGKSVKKVFKKVVKVVKKIVKSDLFKLVVIAAAIYFTAGAVAGMMPAAGAVGVGSTVAGSAVVPSMALTGAATTTIAGGGAALSGLGAAGAAAASGGIMGTLAAITPGQASLASGVMNTVGTGMSSYAAGEAAKEEEKERERERDERRNNSETTLNVYDTFQNRKENRTGDVEVDAGGNTVYAAAPIASLSNVEEQKGQAYYDNSTNTYAQASGGKA